jgi:hypothetical protein
VTSASAVWGANPGRRAGASAQRNKCDAIAFASPRSRAPASCDLLACGGPAAEGGAFKPHDMQPANCTEDGHLKAASRADRARPAVDSILQKGDPE